MKIILLKEQNWCKIKFSVKNNFLNDHWIYENDKNSGYPLIENTGSHLCFNQMNVYKRVFFPRPRWKVWSALSHGKPTFCLAM